MKRRVAIALVLLVAALVAWRLAKLSAPLPGAPVLTPSSSATESEHAEPLQIPSSVDASPADADSRVVAARERSEARAVSRVAPRFVAEARLAVRVVAEGSGEPIGGVKLSLEPGYAGAAERAEARARGEYWRLTAATEGDGRAEFEVPSGTALRVEAESEHTLPGTLAVEAVAPGARGEAELRVELLGDFVVRGLLLDAESRAAIPYGVIMLEGIGSSAARAFVGSSGRAELRGPSVRAGADGRFSVRGMTWRPQSIRATAEGYAPATLSLEPRFAEREEPFEVLLWRGATLEVTVVDAALAPVAGALVRSVGREAVVLGESGVVARFVVVNGTAQRVTPEFDDGLSPRTDERGVARLLDLDPSSPVRIEVRAEGFAPTQPPEPITLAPGERRSLTVRLGRGATIVGRVIDERGGPAVDMEVWLCAGGASAPGSGLLSPDANPTFTGVTDEAGAFRFDAVPTGRWQVGIAPRPAGHGIVLTSFSPRLARGGSQRTWHVPIARDLLVRPDDSELEVVLQIPPQLFLRGTVVDAERRPQPGCPVEARRVGGPEVLTSLCGPAGRFSIGPLTPGAWRLEVRGSGAATESLSESITAEAGQEDLVLELRHGGSISGSVGGTYGRPDFPVALTLSRRGSGEVLASYATPAFTFRGLEPGTYVVRARDLNGRTAASAVIRLDAEEQREGLRLEPGPAGRLGVWNARPGPARVFDVMADGQWIDTCQASETVPAELVLPLGDYTVEWDSAGRRRSKSVRVVAERPAEVELEGDP